MNEFVQVTSQYKRVAIPPQLYDAIHIAVRRRLPTDTKTYDDDVFADAAATVMDPFSSTGRDDELGTMVLGVAAAR